MRAKSGFTLVEILIVVVILGILAAIVIPQFTDASTEAKTSALKSDLQMLRSQIELYKIQHNDDLPSDSAVGLVDALIGYTDQYGVLSTQGADEALGPYMRKIPVNQFVTGALVTPDGFTQGTGIFTPDGATGWWYNTADGDVRANSDPVKWPDHIDY